MKVENVKESVMEAMGASDDAPIAPAESTPAPEEVSSPEVKVEAVDVREVAPVVEAIMAPGEGQPASNTQKDVKEEQINNLNKALSIEREARKKLEEELGSVKPVFDKMKNVFSPDPVVEPTAEPQTEQQKFEEWYEQKEAAKAAEVQNSNIQEMIKTQIETLATEWNGEGGKPKYDDNEVYRWQKDNGKDYLTPEEAFHIMKRNDIIDWHAREALSKTPAPVNSERPAGTSTEHAPTRTTPRTDQEIKNAVLEAMSSIG